MARKNTTGALGASVKPSEALNPISKAVTNSVSQRASMDIPERFQLGEIGYAGLNIFDGISRDELKRELTFPASIRTFKQMSYHSAVNAAVTLFDNLIAKVNWKVNPPPNATEEEKRQAEKLHEMMHDMEHPFSEFISDVLSCNIYGFAVHEKVYRRRLKTKGSMYDDGLIGWKKLPLRSQESIEKFVFSADGNEIIAVKQDLSALHDYYNRFVKRQEYEVVLPRSKVLLFRAGKHRGDPYGKSPLRDAYLAWRYLTALEEIEANGVARDLAGVPLMKIPPQYMSPEASPEMKAVYEHYKNILRNIQSNTQSGLILPQAIDPDSKQPLFTFELMSSDGKKNFDTIKVKEYYKNLILTSLFADVLTLGQGNTGSFALAQVKNSLSGFAAERMLRMITDVLNQDLVKQTYELNGWNPARRAMIDYDNLETESLDEIGKFMQRLGAVGFLPKTKEVINKGLTSLGVDPLDDGVNLADVLTESTSRSGDGMKEGMPSGTGTAVGTQDTSVSNLENA